VTCGYATLRHGTALELSIAGGCTTGSVTAARVAAPTLLDVIPSFQRHLRAENKAARTIKSYAEAVRRLRVPTAHVHGFTDYVLALAS
jgi:hypothetical protein